MANRAAFASVGRDEQDQQRFWLSVLDALRATATGSALVRKVTAAPDLDGWTVVEGLLEDLGSLAEPVWLVIDDLHELRSNEALRQLELLLVHSPAQLRFVLVTRHDLRLGLHRLRLEGGLHEIRADDLRFSRDEAHALFEAAGVQMSDSALAQLVERTEGWAAGLRLAALSLSRHPDPERFATEFSGSERTVAEYLFAEVLDGLSDEVRRLLLRTSMLERVNGELADLLAGGSGGERILQELEETGAFVVSLDARRSWFRYHRLFADLLALELRRSEPEALPALHAAAAGWFSERGYPVEAIRHAQAADDWDMATRLLFDHWLGLFLDGQEATAQELLAAFPAAVVAADAEIAALMAADELTRGSLDEAERYVALASHGSALVAAGRRARFELRLTSERLFLGRQRDQLLVVIEEAQRLLAADHAQGDAQLGVRSEERALGLMALGSAELWAGRVEDAERHLQQSAALGRRLERPFLEILGLGYWAQVASFRSIALGAERAMEAIELGRRQGWSEVRIVAGPDLVLGLTRAWQGRLEDAEVWLERAERAARRVHPEVGMLQYVRGLIDLARGRHPAALSALEAAERLGGRFDTPHQLVQQGRAFRLQALLQMGETRHVEQALAELDERQQNVGETRIVLAALRLQQDDPNAATLALAPVFDGSSRAAIQHVSLIEAFLLEAIARDGLGDRAAAERALEQALDIAEPDGVLLPFLLHADPRLLERHARSRTCHQSLVTEILSLLAGEPRMRAREAAEPLHEPLSDSEVRVLRYLPTNLSKREIADQLYVSLHTIKSHTHRLYSKLGVHSRAEAVERARSLGLLAPSSRV